MAHFMYTLLLLVVFLFYNTGCGVIGGSSTYTTRTGIGTAWLNEVHQKVPSLLEHRYGYDLFNITENPDLLLYQTDWKERILFPQEKNMGAINARTRLRVEARARGRASPTNTGARRGPVTITIENSLEIPEEGWISAEPTDQFNDYINGIISDLRRELIPQGG